MTSLTLIIAVIPALAQQPRFDSATISGLPARNIGSATMSGRIAARRRRGRRWPHHRLHWRSQRRCLEVREWRHYLYKPVFDQPGPFSPSARSPSIRTNSKTSVGRQRRRPGRATASRSVTASISSTDSGENWTNVGLKDSASTSRKFSVESYRDGNDVLRLRHRASLERQRRTRRLPDQRRRQDLEKSVWPGPTDRVVAA